MCTEFVFSDSEFYTPFVSWVNTNLGDEHGRDFIIKLSFCNVNGDANGCCNDDNKESTRSRVYIMSDALQKMSSENATLREEIAHLTQAATKTRDNTNLVTITLSEQITDLHAQVKKLKEQITQKELIPDGNKVRDAVVEELERFGIVLNSGQNVHPMELAWHLGQALAPSGAVCMEEQGPNS